ERAARGARGPALRSRPPPGAGRRRRPGGLGLDLDSLRRAPRGRLRARCGRPALTPPDSRQGRFTHSPSRSIQCPLEQEAPEVSSMHPVLRALVLPAAASFVLAVAGPIAPAQSLLASLTASDAAADDRFGTSV